MADSASTQRDTPELLAPAGDAVCLRAAVRAGANAVYLGLGSLNARRSAENFTLDTLREACTWAHLRGVRIYLAANTIVLPDETSGAFALLEGAADCGVDAFIVQDIGLAAWAVRHLPAVELHASTQMNIHSASGIAALADLGAARVTFARELGLSELARLSSVAHDASMQVEAFAHGALCICYSGQCYASSLVGGRSANRGMCAQVCRLPYELCAGASSAELDTPGKHLLSPKDLWTIDLLPQLVAAGVDSLKIEGRMKSPEYVHAVVSAYREALGQLRHSELHPCHPDRGEESSVLEPEESRDGFTTCRSAVQNPASQDPLREKQKRRLREAFSRGFTTAYLTGETGCDMMSYGRPNNRGVRVGRVSAVHSGLVEIDCDVPLAVGDVIEFWTNKGHFAHTIDALEARREHAIALAVPKPVGKGDRVFRVRSAKAVFADDAQEPRVSVAGTIELRIGRPAKLTLQTAAPPATDAPCIVVEGNVVEAARTKAIVAEEVRDHVDRFGNTPFALERLDVQLDEGVGMGFSALHHLRAAASDALEAALLRAWEAGRAAEAKAAARRVATREEAGRALAEEGLGASRGLRSGDGALGLAVCALASNPACAQAACEAGADAVYVSALNRPRSEAGLEGRRSPAGVQERYPADAILALPVADHDLCEGSREARFGFDAWEYVRAGETVLAEGIGDVCRALDAGAKVEAGPHFPLVNPLSVRYVESLGVARIWLSCELNLGQIRRIAEGAQVPLGLVVSGAAELMVTEHCLLQSQGPCDQDCPACQRRFVRHFLKDRKGYRMPVLTDLCGRSHLYNAVPLDVCHLLPELADAGVSAFMVDTTLLDVPSAARAVERAVRARDLACRRSGAVEKIDGATTGHIFRGVS